MDNLDRALISLPGRSLATLRDADVQHVGALILSTLDRQGVSNQDFSRIVVYGRRIIVFDLPWLSYRRACRLVEEQQWGQRLTQLIGRHVTPHGCYTNDACIALRERPTGCCLIVDLAGCNAAGQRAARRVAEDCDLPGP